MPQLILFNKPYGVLSQFSDPGDRPTLADYIVLKNIYPAGRLDRDSEGLLLLTDDGQLQHRISDPRHKLPKCYWIQVENIPAKEDLEKLRNGLELDGKMTLPAKARLIEPPDIWPRLPPVRIRRNIPTSWIELILHEGRNRQARRMTAAVGYPTLRLIRYSIGPWTIDNLGPGQWRQADLHEINRIFR
jgi:23S rRNA pseudouridine2457 synthase